MRGSDWDRASAPERGAEKADEGRFMPGRTEPAASERDTRSRDLGVAARRGLALEDG
jgi:hypothetical protein